MIDMNNGNLPAAQVKKNRLNRIKLEIDEARSQRHVHVSLRIKDVEVLLRELEG